MAATVAVGFGPTFYLRPVVAGPPLRSLLLLHGFLFTAWIVVFVTQATLVANHRTDLHRRLGGYAAALAAVMLVVGLATAISGARLGHVPVGAPPPLVFLIIPFSAIVLFAGFVAAGIHQRGRPETHKRLMLLASASILGAAVARLPLLPPMPPVFFGVSDLFVVAGIVYDLRTRGRVHPAYIWGGLILLLSQPLQLMLSGTSAWLAFAHWLTA